MCGGDVHGGVKGLTFFSFFVFANPPPPPKGGVVGRTGQGAFVHGTFRQKDSVTQGIFCPKGTYHAMDASSKNNVRGHIVMKSCMEVFKNESSVLSCMLPV